MYFIDFIGAVIDDRGLEIKSYEDLAKLMSGMKEKAINKVTLSNLNEAYQVAWKIIAIIAAIAFFAVLLFK